MGTLLDIRAPEEQTEGTRSQVLRWLRQVGERVREHEPLIELETDKVTVEIPAPASGVLREILKHEQDEIAPGEVLGRLEAAAPAGVSTASAAEQSAPTEQVALRAADPAVSGAAEARASGATSSTPREESLSSPARMPAAHRGARGLSPAVKRLLAERGLDAAEVRGTGPGGRITVDDVLAHATAVRAPAPAEPASDGVPEDRGIPSHLVPHSAVRKRIAEHMVQSLLHTAPHVTTVFEADMSAIVRHRQRHRLEFESQGAPLTFTAYFLAATVEAIRAVPEANSRWTETALEIYDAIHIGVATAIEDVGLVVPVLRNVESKDLLTIARELHEIVAAARAGKLTPADVRGGTFTISNHGVSGSLLAAPIVINQPQSAILGIGKVEQRLQMIDEVSGGRVEARPKCYVTLTIDHRVMDGHRANRFLATLVNQLEHWPES